MDQGIISNMKNVYCSNFMDFITDDECETDDTDAFQISFSIKDAVCDFAVA